MQIDVRPVRRLRESAGARGAFGPILEALAGSAADLARLRVVCDWIQYKANFRDPVMARPVLAAGLLDGPAASYDIAVDLRRCAPPAAHVEGAMSAGLAQGAPAAGADSDDGGCC